MTIQYASDLHLEFAENTKFLADNPIVPSADVLILAGDIGYINHPSYETHPFWDWAAENYSRVLVVPGNHEFYDGYDLCNVGNEARGEIRHNIHWYYNRTEIIDGVEFILSPLWSFIPPGAQYIIEHRVSDFKYIRHHGKRLTAEAFNNLHRQSVNFIKESLANNNVDKKIVVTHHLPSMCCVAPHHKGDILNGAFASEQANWIENCGVDYWIYGHSHSNIEPQTIGHTKLVCNQLGYVQYNEHYSFKNSVQIIL